jgi:hypothetical protein
VIRVALLAAPLLVAACRTLSPAVPLPADDPRPQAYLAAWGAWAEERRSLRGVVRLAVDGDALRLRSRQVLVAERPSRLRVEVQGLLNQTIAVLVTDGERYELLRAEVRAIERGPVHAGLLWEVAGLALTPREAVELLLGAPQLDTSLRVAAARQTPGGEVSLDLVDPAGEVRQRVAFDRDARLRGFERREDGHRLWSARYDEYEPVGATAFAHAIALELAGGIQAELRLRGVELNPTLPADIFQLPPLDGAGG